MTIRNLGFIRTQRQITCPICGGQGGVFRSEVKDYYFGSPGVWSLSKCFGNCLAVWLDPAPTPDDIGNAYLNYHTHESTNKHSTRKDWRRLYEVFLNIKFRSLSIFRKLLSERKKYRYMFLKEVPTGKLLDVGCGGGRFLRRMQKSGWTVEGVDFDDKAAERVKNKYGIKTYVGDLRNLDIPSESYDAIVMSHAIEHVFDPVSLLVECNKLLKKEGRLVIITPNAGSVAHRRFGKYWRGLEVPRHIQIFSRKGMDICLKEAGFAARSVTTFSHHSEGIYRVSAELRSRELSLPSDLFESILKSKIYMLAEYRHLIRNPDSGEDILAIAIKK